MAIDTPYIDRRSPMPPEVKGDSGLNGVTIFWCTIAGIVMAILASGAVGDAGPRVAEAIAGAIRRVGMLNLFLVLLVTYYLTVITHELGHVAGGLAAGFRFGWIRVGPVLVAKDRRVMTYRGPGRWAGGGANMVPVTTENFARRAALLVVAGPLANLVAVAVLLAFARPFNIWTGAYFYCSLVTGLTELIPMRTRLGTSDGARLRMLCFDPPRGERWLALLALQSEIEAGVLPELYSKQFLLRALAVVDDSVDTAMAHMIGYASAFYGGTPEEAERCLETSLQYSSYCPPALREMLISDVAVHVGSMRRDRQLAEQWLANLPAQTQFKWLRARAETAVLDAAGDRDGALAKFDETQQLLFRDLHGKPTKTVVTLMSRWRERISAPQQA